MIFLLKADFTQGTWSALVPGLLVKLLVWRSDTLENEAAINFSDKVLKSSRLLLDKVKEERSGIRLVDFILIFVHFLISTNHSCFEDCKFSLLLQKY